MKTRFLRSLSIALAAALALMTCVCALAEPQERFADTVHIEWLPQCDEPVDPDSEVIAAIERMFNVDINFWYLERTNREQLLAVRMAAGEVPDVFNASSMTYISDYVDQGVLRVIPKSMLEATAPSLKSLYENNFRQLGDIWDLTSFDGETYCLPNGSVTGSYTSPNLWRGDWLKAVGVDKIPETVEEAENAFYLFKTADPDGNGRDDTYALSKFGMTRWLWSYGGTGTTYKLDADGNVIINLLTDTFRDGFGKLVQFYGDGLIDPEFITGENRGQYWASSIAFWNGVIGFTAPGNFYHVNPSVIAGDVGSSVNSTGFVAQNPGLFYEYGPMLKGEDTLLPVGGVYPNSGIVFGANCEDKTLERILAMFEAICTDYDGVWTLVEWGIPDYSYTVEYDESGLPIYTRIGNFAVGNDFPYDVGLKGNGVNLIESSCYEFCKTGEAQLYAWGDANANSAALGAPEYVNPCYGVLSEDALTIKTSVEAKYEEAYNLFITGQRPFNDEEWRGFIGELYAAGLQTWLDEATAWVKSNA